ncbi:MAG: isoprenylcysteine carboxylmethyltransferase family protein, partial [Bacteroidetes bacterium]|nr:isoprenylcysteine carboxylmethyltransferase family protein [Bacteroidota bacterium]
MDIRQKWFSIRSYMPIPFLFVAIYFGKPNLQSIIFGYIFILLGESIRLWGVSVAGSETRTTSKVGGTHLFTDGPFGYVRNPLYIGNIIIFSGSMIAANAFIPSLPIFAFFFFWIQYRIIISSEENYLQNQFGLEFESYKKNVPRFIPRFTKYKGEHSFHREPEILRGIKSEKRTFQTIIIFLFLLILKLYK